MTPEEKYDFSKITVTTDTRDDEVFHAVMWAGERVSAPYIDFEKAHSFKRGWLHRAENKSLDGPYGIYKEPLVDGYQQCDVRITPVVGVGDGCPVDG